MHALQVGPRDARNQIAPATGHAGCDHPDIADTGGKSRNPAAKTETAPAASDYIRARRSPLTPQTPSAPSAPSTPAKPGIITDLEHNLYDVAAALPGVASSKTGSTPRPRSPNYSSDSSRRKTGACRTGRHRWLKSPRQFPGPAVPPKQESSAAKVGFGPVSRTEIAGHTSGGKRNTVVACKEFASARTLTGIKRGQTGGTCKAARRSRKSRRDQTSRSPAGKDLEALSMWNAQTCSRKNPKSPRNSQRRRKSTRSSWKR